MSPHAAVMPAMRVVVTVAVGLQPAKESRFAAIAAPILAGLTAELDLLARVQILHVEESTK